MAGVNRRHLEIRVSLPREFESLEGEIRERLQRRLSRGRVSARVAVLNTRGEDLARVVLNEALAKECAAQLRNLAAAAGIEGVGMDDERLLKEVVLFADRSDISEELTRLQSHFDQFDALARSRQPVGRTLDFLAQEMHREVNTIGAKANDALISKAVVSIKTELEKFREQVQNVE